MKIIGNKVTFGLEIGEQINSSLRVVNIFIGGENICYEDNHVYLPQFINSISVTAENLRKKIDYYKYINYLEWMSLEEAHNFLLDTSNSESPHYNLENNKLYLCYSIFQWGPTTDDASCFLIPMNDVLYLTYSFPSKANIVGYNSVSGVAITPYEIIHVIENSLSELKGLE